MTASQEKLADVPVAVTPVEDQQEPPKALKKKNGSERPKQRVDHQVDGHRDRTYRAFDERSQSYNREREKLFSEGGFNENHDQLRPTQSLRNGSDGGASNDFGAKATFRNRQQELRDPEFQRYRPGGMMDANRFRPPMPGEEMEHMIQMMQGMGIGPGPDSSGMAYAQHPNAVAIGPPYSMHAHPMNFGYQGPMVQQMPQGMGMYGATGVPYGYPQVQQQYPPAGYSQQFLQPYPYPMQMRPPNGMMQPYAGQQMSQNMMPYYQPFFQQGYSMPGPGPQANRPNYAGPPRPQQAYQNHALPRNGSGGYNRKPAPTSNRPVKPEANAVPKAAVELPGVTVASPAAPAPASPSKASLSAGSQEVLAEPGPGSKEANNTQA